MSTKRDIPKIFVLFMWNGFDVKGAGSQEKGFFRSMEAAESHAKLLFEENVMEWDSYQILNTETCEWSDVITL